MIENWMKSPLFRAILIGICLSAAYPPVNLFPLLWVGLWLLVKEVRNSSGIRHAMARVYLPLVFWNLGTTYWLMMATLPGGLAAIFANSVVLAVPLGLMWPFLTKRMPQWIGILAAAAVWVLFEWIHTRWELAWPWLQLGNGLSAWPSIYQWISLTGVFGLSFWVFVSVLLIPDRMSVQGRKYWLPFSVFTFIPILLSVGYFSIVDQKPDSQVTVTVVQPNYDSYLRIGGYDEPITPLLGLIELSDSVSTAESKLIIWPENAVMQDIYSGYPNEAQSILEAMVRDRDVTLIAGATFMNIYPADTQEPLIRRFNNGVPFKAYNSAMSYAPGDSLKLYFKRHLVPMVETIPYLAFLDAIDVVGFNIPQMNSYHRGVEAVNFETPYGLVPAMVCYDSVFPNWVRTTVRDGAIFVSVITNDGWWGNTSGHHQHFEFAKLRAVETRRAVVRSANNGLSGVIDASGVVLNKTDYWVRTGFTDEIPVYTTMTLYTLWGDWFVVVCGGMVLVGAVFWYRKVE